MKRVVSFLLCICMIITLTGCMFGEGQGRSERPDPEYFTPIGPTEQPDNEKVMIVPRPDSSALPFEYTLTQEQVTEFYDLLERCEQVCMSNADAEAVEQVHTEVEDYMLFLEDQAGIAQLIYYADQSDEVASQRFLDCSDMMADTNDAYIEMLRRIYASDSTAKAVIFADWTEQDLQMLENYTSEVADLEKRNAQILVDYQALEDPAADAMVPMYLEQVYNNNRIAQIYGYENYYEYAFEMVYERDYAPEQLVPMREYVAKYLADDFENAFDEVVDGMEDLAFMDSMRFSGFLSMDYDQMDQDYVGMYFQSLPEQVRDGMMDAFQPGNSYFTSNPEAYEGAFTTVIGGESFCYYGPGYASCNTIVHEVGHYYGSQYTDMSEISYDLAETQSQGNEWLFTAMLEKHLGEDLYDAFVNYRFYNDMTTVLICVIVDEFEQQIYSHPDPRSLTAADCNQIMEEVCVKYGGTEYIASYITDIQGYWRMVVLQNPVYYISYAVSAVSAMSIYTLYQQDPDLAVNAYRTITERDWEEDGFLVALEEAGLPNPFAESVYQKLGKRFH